jgi:ABC-type amino acid transport substrate-binding protein
VKKAQLVPVTSIDEGVAALRERRIDYFVHDAPTIWRIVGGFLSTETELTGLYRPLTEEYLAWAVRKDADGLARQLEQSLAEWRADGRLDLVLDSRIRVRRIQVD